MRTHPKARREPPPMTRTHRPSQQRTGIKQTLPTTSTPYRPIVSTPFLSMPNLTARYSPQGITIPTGYTRPTPLLKQSPVHSNVSNPTVPNPTSHQLPNPTTQKCRLQHTPKWPTHRTTGICTRSRR